MTPAALKQAVDALVRRGNEVEVIAARKAPYAQDIARLDRELANLTAAIATGQRPDVVQSIAETDTWNLYGVATFGGLSTGSWAWR